jgi:hypothetical protein
LHGKEKHGFETLVDELYKRKMAKWTLATVIQTYYRPNKEILIKPTTTKLILKELEIDLTYQPTPTWAFYKNYRKIINESKKGVSSSLSPNNPAYCGVLMMSLEKIN